MERNNMNQKLKWSLARVAILLVANLPGFLDSSHINAEY